MKIVGVQIKLVLDEGLFELIDQVAIDNFKETDEQGQLAQLFLKSLKLYCAGCYEDKYSNLFQPENLSIHDIKVI